MAYHYFCWFWEQRWWQTIQNWGAKGYLMDRCYVSLNGKRHILDIQEENIIFEMFQFINIKSIVISLRECSTPTQRWVAAIGVEMNNFFLKSLLQEYDIFSYNHNDPQILHLT